MWPSFMTHKIGAIRVKKKAHGGSITNNMNTIWEVYEHYGLEVLLYDLCYQHFINFVFFLSSLQKK